MLNPKENEGALARKSILFVDDDVSVLDSFRTSLRAYRDEWDMHFVAGGEEAMRVLAHDSFDVVICDMHMPVVDGATVLSHLKARHPKSLRILLSGQAEHEAALRLVPLAHQFLAKPCDPARTREVILRAAALQSRLHSSELRVSVSQVSQLPSPPETYTKLLNCMSSGGGSIRKIVAIVEEDPAICAKILQVANSPFFGARQPVADIQRAVMVMGTNFVRDLVLAFQSISSARKLLAPGLISLEDEQSRGLQVGQAARVIAKELVPDLANEAMVAGLLHDIGRVILAVLRPQQWRAYSDALDKGRLTDIDAERKYFAMTHGEIGGYLLSLWGLPYEIVEAVTFHHDPGRLPVASTFDLVGVTHLAEAVVSGGEDPDAVMSIHLDRKYLDRFGINSDIHYWRQRIGIGGTTQAA